MKLKLFSAFAALLCLLTFSACNENDATYSEYTNWKTRNDAYFATVMAHAKDTIAKCKATYGDQWENHCRWRTFKTTSLVDTVAGKQTDSICVEILENGTGSGYPLYTDSVKVNYRGYLIKTLPEGAKDSVNHVFDHTGLTEYYSSVFSPQYALPTTQAVFGLIRGYSTALQHMRIGDLWRIYIPADLAYGSSTASSGAIPAYSTLMFEVQLKAFYRAGITPGIWQ